MSPARSGFGEGAPRIGNHRLRQARQCSNLQAETAVGRAFLYRVHEHQLLAVFDSVKMYVRNRRILVGQLGQLEIVRGEQRVGTAAGGEVHGGAVQNFTGDDVSLLFYLLRVSKGTKRR